MKDILYKHNIQWSVSEITTGVTRNLLAKIINALSVKHIIAIAGARRSGKSYIFRQIIKHLQHNDVSAENIFQINFEDPYFIHRKNDPELLSDLFAQYLTTKNPTGRKYVFFDEIQNIKDWQYWIRDMYDREEEVKFFITGSNADMLSIELNTHLTGRVIAYENFPFSLKELLKYSEKNIKLPSKSVDVEQLYQLLFKVKEKLLYYIERTFKYSFFPEVCSIDNDELVTDILNQYFTNVIFKDIVPRFSIRNSRVIEELAYYLSTNFTSEFSYCSLAKTVKSNENTVKDYISFFEKAYLFYTLPHLDFSLKKQMRREKKIYIGDVGLRTATAYQFSPDAGRYMENIVYNHLRINYKNIFFWKSKLRKEIDFIIQYKGCYIAINVCYSDDIPEREFAGFAELEKENIKSIRNIIVSKNKFENCVVNNVAIEIIPIWCFLLLDNISIIKT